MGNLTPGYFCSPPPSSSVRKMAGFHIRTGCNRLCVSVVTYTSAQMPVSRHGFAGGATSGTDFAAGFRYEKMNSADKPGYRKTLRIVDAVQPPIFGVAAHKSYFLFGETLLALGSGITNLTPREPSGARSVSLPETLPRLISAPPPEENAAPLPPHSPRFPRKPHAGNCAENSFSEETGNPFLLNNELIGSMMQYHVIFC